MVRKLALAFVAAAALGTAALAPTSASAWWGGGWHGYHGYHGGWHGFYGYQAYRPWRSWCFYHPYQCY